MSTSAGEENPNDPQHVEPVQIDPVQIDTVLIDWGGTITIPMRDAFAPLLERHGLDVTSVLAAFGTAADPLGAPPDDLLIRAETGQIADDDFEAEIEARAPGLFDVLDPSDPPSLFDAADRPEMIALLEDCNEAGVFVLIATNNLRVAHDTLARRYLEPGLVQGIANSALMGVRKPDPNFFELCLEAAGAEPETTLFLDDRADNIEAAQALGIHGVLVDDDPLPAVATARRLLGFE